MKLNESHPINPLLNTFIAAKAAHLENVKKLNELQASITRCQQQQQEAENDNQQAENSWRKLFRKLRGEMTEELQSQHATRIAKRELAKEFAGLIEEIKLDESLAKLYCCSSAKEYQQAHKETILAYADMEMKTALENLSQEIIRAAKIKITAYKMYGSRPATEILNGVKDHLIDIASKFELDMEKEPVLSELKLHQPALEGVDDELYNSPIKWTRLALSVKEKREQLGLN
ncbi:aldehyde dehydrogenase [Yersinia enterocolitica]